MSAEGQYFPIAGSSYYGVGQYLIFFTDWRCARFTEAEDGSLTEGPWGDFEWDSENCTGCLNIDGEKLDMYMDRHSGELMVETAEGSEIYYVMEYTSYDPYND